MLAAPNGKCICVGKVAVVNGDALAETFQARAGSARVNKEGRRAGSDEKKRKIYVRKAGRSEVLFRSDPCLARAHTLHHDLESRSLRCD